MRSKSTANVKAQTHGRLLGSQSFVSFSGASFMVAYFPVLEWQALGWRRPVQLTPASH